MAVPVLGGSSTNLDDRLDPYALSGSSVRWLRRLLTSAMVLAVVALAAIVLIGFLQGP